LETKCLEKCLSKKDEVVSNLGYYTCIASDFIIYMFLHSVINIMKSRRIRWAEHVAKMGNKEIASAIFVGKFFLKTSTWMVEKEMNNNRMDWEIGCGDGKCTKLAQ
jgi:hypothetical protein